MHRSVTVPLVEPVSVDALIAQRNEHLRMAEELQKEIFKLTRPSLLDLSYRQCQVVELIRLGLSNKEIAAKLFISITTVKYHVSKSLKSMGLKNCRSHEARQLL